MARCRVPCVSYLWRMRTPAVPEAIAQSPTRHRKRAGEVGLGSNRHASRESSFPFLDRPMGFQVSTLEKLCGVADCITSPLPMIGGIHFWMRMIGPMI